MVRGVVILVDGEVEEEMRLRLYGELRIGRV